MRYGSRCPNSTSPHRESICSPLHLFQTGHILRNPHIQSNHNLTPAPHYSSIDLDFILSILKTEAACYSETMVSITNRIASEIKRPRPNRGTAAKILFRTRQKPVPHGGSLVGSQNFGVVSSNCAYFCHMASVVMFV